MVDYAFAPGIDDQDARCRALFRVRNATGLVDLATIRTVQGFIKHLQSSSTVTRPIGDILLGTHAGTDGWFELHLFPNQPNGTMFEEIEEAISNAAKSVSIPNTLTGQSPTGPIAHTVHIVGCNIGRATAFITELARAFGGRVKVTAPLHFHGIYQAGGLGVFETFAYELVVSRPDPVGSRTALLDAFDAAHFKGIDNSTIRRATLDDLIPQKWAPYKSVYGQTRAIVPRTLGTTVGKRSVLFVEVVLRVDAFEMAETIPRAGGTSLPTDNPGQIAFTKAYFLTKPTFASTHKFPWYARMGFKNIDDFMAGYKWTFQVTPQALIATYKRVVYTLTAPIEDAKSHLHFNFHPNTGTGLATIIGVPTTNTAFFATV